MISKSTLRFFINFLGILNPIRMFKTQKELVIWLKKDKKLKIHIFLAKFVENEIVFLKIIIKLKGLRGM